MNVTLQLDGDLEDALERYGDKVAEDLAYSGAAAMARIIHAEVELNTSGEREGGPGVVTGNLHRAIYWAKNTTQSNARQAVYDVSWNKRKAPHGHLLEFGTSKMAARPFVRPAMSRMADAVRAGLERMRQRLAELQK